MMNTSHPPVRDPLDSARTQLDFAALAAGAPAVKDILFKAQTMAPFAPPRLWKKLLKGAGAVTAGLLLLFAPVLPSHLSYTLLRLEFERPLAPARAQEAIDAACRALPPEVLVGVEQRQSQGSQAVAPRVVLRLSATGWSGSRLRRSAEAALAQVANEAMPLYYPAEEFKQGGRHSLVQAVSGWLTPDTGPHYRLRGEYGEQAERLLRIEPVLAAELAARLGVDGYQLSALKFVAAADSIPNGYDFVTPSWPLPVAVAVAGYASELDSEQQLVQTRTAEFLREFNLMPQLGPGADPLAQWPAVVVAVQDTEGRLNPQLSARVQAEISQPSRRQADDSVYRPRTAVEQALSRVLPWASYELLESHTQRADGSMGWQVVAVIEGARGRRLRLFEEQPSPDADSGLF
jgi:hypothetical protein